MQTKSGKYTATVTSNLPYLLYLPDDYEVDSEKQWPFILFLHGAGERGSNLELVKAHGIPKKLENGDDLPFIVLAPQCPTDNLWSHYPQALITMVDAVLANYRVDESRIYLTGLSMGGFGTWHLATEYPERFAALAPICGFGAGLLGFPERLKRIAHIPTWVFHGDADDVVPIGESQQFVDALKEYGGDVQFTVYPGVNHDSWTQTYANPDLYKWFLEHSR